MVSFRAAAALALAYSAFTVGAVDIVVQASGGNMTQGHQYGFLHEDINYSGDGGIYAELIRNRAFQYSQQYPVSLDGWQPINNANLRLQTLGTPLSNALPYSMNVSPRNPWKGGTIGFTNAGYWGMDVKQQKYTGSFWVYGAYNGSFTASLRSALTSDVFGEVQINSKATGREWIEHEFELVPTVDAPNSNNTFAITFDSGACSGGCSLDFNLISLFPPTYKGRKNGLRIDLAEATEELHPTIFRFPGGNMLEGNTRNTRWNWKDTVQPIRYRPGFPSPWGYQQTHGLGLMEYLYWAEDMKMEMVVAVYAGLSLNGDVTPVYQLQPFIDDALDEIEFICGPANSTWGKVRAQMGHPEPFKLNYVEIGNEDWLAGGAAGWESYQNYRFPMFMQAILERYPEMHVISSGATSDGYQVPSPGLGDYHPYRTPDELVAEFNRFDNDQIPHIVGEMSATHPNGGIGWDGPLYTFPWWIGSVGGAISLIGQERNAARVHGSFYAPVLRNMNKWRWAMTIIQHAADPAMTTRSTDWYVWELMGSVQLKETLPATKQFEPLYYVAGKSMDDEFVWKGAVYNTTRSMNIPVSVSFEGVGQGTKASLKMLTGPTDPYGYNDPHLGNNVVETREEVIEAGEDGMFSFVMPELSVALLKTEFGGKRRSVE